MGVENIWCVRELGGRGMAGKAVVMQRMQAGKAVIFNAKISNLQHSCVTVLCRS